MSYVFVFILGAALGAGFMWARYRPDRFAARKAELFALFKKKDAP